MRYRDDDTRRYDMLSSWEDREEVSHVTPSNPDWHSGQRDSFAHAT